MNTENLAGELRGLAARHDADHRAREILNDAAGFLVQYATFVNEVTQALSIEGEGYTLDAIAKQVRDLKTQSGCTSALLQQIGEILEVPAGHQHQNLPNVLLERLEAQNMRDGQEETPAKGAVSDHWVGDVVDLLHLLAGDLAHENRLMAITARQLILNAPRLCADLADGVWHDWHGGECPVGLKDAVEARFRDGTDSGKTLAWELVWSHDGNGADIVAWRRVN